MHLKKVRMFAMLMVFSTVLTSVTPATISATVSPVVANAGEQTQTTKFDNIIEKTNTEMQATCFESEEAATNYFLQMVFDNYVGFSIFAKDLSMLHTVEEYMKLCPALLNLEIDSVTQYHNGYMITFKNIKTYFDAKQVYAVQTKDTSFLNENELQAYNKLFSITNELKLDGMNDIDKVVAIHDYLVLNTAYDTNAANSGVQTSSHYAEGTLNNGLAVCSGYASAFRLLLMLQGISSEYAWSDSGHHGWNLVKLDDKWYHVDVTWDDPVPDEKGRVLHTYFMMTDSEVAGLDQHEDWECECGNEKGHNCIDTTYRLYPYREYICTTEQKAINVIESQKNKDKVTIVYPASSILTTEDLVKLAMTTLNLMSVRYSSQGLDGSHILLTVYNPNANEENKETVVIGATSRLLGTSATIANISMNPLNGSVKKGDNVTVTAPSMLRYNFKGWYLLSDINASNQIIDGRTAWSTKLTATYKAEEDVMLVAVYEVAEKMATINFTGEGNFTISVNGGEAIDIQNNIYSLSATVGSKVTITAKDENFMNWCNANNKIVTTQKTYTFVVTGDTTLKMSKKENLQGSAKVEFISDYNQVIASEVYNSNTTITFPVGPSKMGYTFVGWNLTQEQIHAKIDAGETYIKVTPVYKQDEATYKITVYVDGTEHNELSVSNVSAGSTKTIQAPSVKGKVFLYWTDEKGTVLGYDTSYFMQVNKDIKIYAVYGEEQVDAQPVIAMTNVYTTIENGKKKLSFTATRDIPEGYTLVEHGMLYHTKQEITNPSEDTFILGGNGVNKYVSTDNKLSGVFTLTINATNHVDVKMIARGYMILKDTTTGVEEIYYTNIANNSYSEMSK